MKKVRVLFVIDHLGFSGGVTHGGTTYLATVLPALAERGIEPRLVVMRGPHPASELLESKGIPVAFLARRKWDPTALPTLLRLIRSQPTDLLHLGGMKSHLLGRLAATITGLPAVVHQHHMIPQGLVLRLLHRCLPQRRVKFLAVSEAVQALAGKTFGAPPERIEVLYNGMEFDKYATPSTPDARRRIRDELEIPATAPLVGVIGRVCHDKGQDRLIRAMGQIRVACPGTRLLVVGDGPDREAYESLAADLELDDVVHFTGQRDDVRDLLAAVDVVAVPSMWEEAFGYTALEASAAGRPIVTFRSGGLAEVALDGETGLVVSKGDGDGMARALVRLLTDEGLREAMGKRGREHAARFTVSANVDGLQRIYESPLSMTAPDEARSHGETKPPDREPPPSIPAPAGDTDPPATDQVAGLASGSAVVLAGLPLRVGLLMVFELIAARYLGPAGYGTFSLAFTIVVVLSFMSVLGLQLSLRRFISYHIEKRQLAEVRGLITFGVVWPAVAGMLLGGLLFISADWLSEAVFGKPELAPILSVMAFVVPMWATRRLSTVIYSAYKKPLYKVALEDVLEPLLRVLTALMVGILGWGVLQLSYWTLATYVIVVLVSWFLVDRGRRQIVGTGGPRRIPWRELLTFSTPLVVSEFGNIILAWAGILLLGLLSVEREVGLFRAVSQPPMLASAMLTAFGFIYLPMATAMFVRDQYGEWDRANSAVARWAMSLSFPVATVCVLFPGEVIGIVFGQEYTGGAMAMQILGATYLFHAACGFTGINLIVAGHTWLQMTATLLAIATNIGLSLVWIPRFGATGAAGAILAMTMVRNVFNLIATKALLGLDPFNKRFLGLLVVHLISAGSLAGGAHLLQIPSVASMFAVGLLQLPFAALLGYFLGVLDKTDLDLIQRLREAKDRRNAG